MDLLEIREREKNPRVLFFETCDRRKSFIIEKDRERIAVNEIEAILVGALPENKRNKEKWEMPVRFVDGGLFRCCISGEPFKALFRDSFMVLVRSFLNHYEKGYTGTIRMELSGKRPTGTFYLG